MITTMSPDQLWSAALGELELAVSKANYTTWLKDTFILRVQSGAVVVGVPNTFTKTWLENKYHPSIVKALRRIADEDIQTVSYQVASRKAQSLRVAPPEPEPYVPKPEATPEVAPRPVSTPVRTPSKGETVTITVNAAQKDTLEAVGLNPVYTFENFVVGKKNELAHAACLAAAERPGFAYNPLFIYGGVGLGKTHLMQAVGQTALKRDPRIKVLYVTCETFTNEFIKMVGAGRADEFKGKYRSVDILMVDDIQFLAGKEGTQEAFFHTFNHLYQHNKQILLTSDRHPRAIPTLEHRLVSRFEGGMIVDVSLPDLETRIAILTQKCEQKNYQITPELAQFLASNIQNNIRELEGTLNRVIAYHQLNNIQPTIETVKPLLSSFAQTPRGQAVTARKIVETVADFFEVEMPDLVGNSRKKELVVPRQIAMFLMREEIHASYPNIGQELGGRDHTTAMHACQKIGKLREEDEKTESDLSMIRQRLYN